MHRTLALAIVCLFGLSAPAASCSFFSYAGEDLVLFGNSEDYLDENTFL